MNIMTKNRALFLLLSLALFGALPSAYARIDMEPFDFEGACLDLGIRLPRSFALRRPTPQRRVLTRAITFVGEAELVALRAGQLRRPDTPRPPLGQEQIIAIIGQFLHAVQQHENQQPAAATNNIVVNPATPVQFDRSPSVDILPQTRTTTTPTARPDTPRLPLTRATPVQEFRSLASNNTSNNVL